MARKPKTALYFTTVLVVEKKLAVLGGHLYQEKAEPSITRPLVCSVGDWSHLDDVDDVVYATAKKPSDTPGAIPTLCFMGRMGNYREIAKGKPIVNKKLDIASAGYLMDLRYIGDHLYACGVQNIIYKQVDQRWVRMDKGIFAPIGDEVDRTLESIDGFADDDIYAVGDGGAIWHWNGNHWTRLDSPTNMPLYCVLCTSNGDVYIGGSGGVLLKGREGKGWTDLSDPSVTVEVLEDMTEFKGRIYATATDLLLSTDGKSIEQVDVPIKGEKSYYAIDSVADALWCVGDDCVLQFDGKKWNQYVCPDNV